MTVVLTFVLLTTCSYGCYGATIVIRGGWSRWVAVSLGFMSLAFVGAVWWFLSQEYVHGAGRMWHLCLLLASAAFGVASLVHGMSPVVQSVTRNRRDCATIAVDHHSRGSGELAR